MIKNGIGNTFSVQMNSALKGTVKGLLPPAVYGSLRARYRDKFGYGSNLFGGSGGEFKSLAAQSSVYGEYGCGQSTIWVANNTEMEIYSVDTSNEWIQNVKAHIRPGRRIGIHHINLGDLEEFGWPASYSKREKFSSYTDEIWKHSKSPDLVLIDGRFRVCCFLTCLKYGKPGANIVFDDYSGRGRYKIAEEFCQIKSMFGRQALFKVPEPGVIDYDRLDLMIDRFRYVIE